MGQKDRGRGFNGTVPDFIGSDIKPPSQLGQFLAIPIAEFIARKKRVIDGRVWETHISREGLIL